jgi:ribonucleotide reductase alpha subunit
MSQLCGNYKSLGKLSTIDPTVVAQDTVSRLYDTMPTTEIDEEAARIAVSKTENPEYLQLASRIIVSNHHRNIEECFSETMERLYEHTDENGDPAPMLSTEFIELVRKHKETLNFIPDYKLDYNFDYFGFKTLERSYLQKINKRVVERPQHMYLRVALALLKDDLPNVEKTYGYLANGYYTQASPTLFNAGTRLNQLSSCFLLYTQDSIEGIFKTIQDTAFISKLAGGIGIPISNVRCRGSYIRGTSGPSDGIIPMLKVYNEVGKYINQGGKRKGSIACYLEPFHGDIMEFLDLRKAQGHEDLRARDLFLAIWMSDLFMEQVEKDGDWYLMCPDKSPNLTTTFGEDHCRIYWEHVQGGRFIKKIKAQELWHKILESQIETGTPYIVYKDAVNKKSNQKNIGMIKSSNLCVHGDTYILTDKGDTKIEELENKETSVWNGKEFSKVTVYKTGTNQKLTKVCFNDGGHLVCTPKHKFYINANTSTELRTHELCVGMQLVDYELPGEKKTTCGITITEIIPDYTIADTYCFTEPKEHKGVFNGYLTGQCSEIVLYSDENEYGTCNLESIALPKFVVKKQKNSKPYFDHELMHTIVKDTIRTMNNVIDFNYYPVPETRRSNERHRPIGVGVQGLHDVYIKMRYPFESEAARKLNKEIFETIYHACIQGSMELAKEHGPYSTFKGSPMSEGKFQFDMWAETDGIDLKEYLSGRYDWDLLRSQVMEFGVRNSMFTTCVPTASTAQILGNTEAIEPFDSCIFKRRVLAGEYIVMNKYLVADLQQLGLWSEETKNEIIRNNGSVQSIDSIPDEIKELYKNVWELSQKALIDQSAERGPFIDHTQSLNLFMEKPTKKKMTSMFFYGWKRGLKTGVYYFRSRSQARSAMMSSGVKKGSPPKNQKPTPEEILACSLENPEACDMCSS